MSKAPVKGTSRRGFLKLAGIAAAGVLAITRLFRTAWAGHRIGGMPAALSTGRQDAPRVPPEPEVPTGRVRFTDRARRIVFRAWEEAAQMDTDRVGPEHLCLALLNQYDCTGLEALNVLRGEVEPLGIPIGRVHSDLRRLSAPGSGHRGRGAQMTPGAMRVMNYAREEARMLGNGYLGSEHLLLGLIREDDGLPSRVLIGKHCITANLDRVRQVVLEVQQRRRNVS